MEQAYPLNSTPPIFTPSRPLALARSGAFAFGITGLLLLGMTQLIATDYRAPPEELPPKVAPIHLPDLTPTVQESLPPAKPQEIPPALQPVKVESRVTPGEIPTGITPPAVDDTGLDPSIISTDPLPIYKPAPRYPRRALSRGMEGYVVVEFTITPSGGVRDANVVGGYKNDGEPTTVFDREALRAVERFKYRPPMSEGRPVEKHGVRNRIVFKMAE
ncbi:energy transducer TonB [Microbulbifer sp.]|uniref:energy transducer TonB n=1 Tax=Microbulbifer sp. TaxID=1908541 RepID=UPI00258A4B59|nr:energy transducer TonB [Microbulbifer sp.]